MANYFSAWGAQLFVDYFDKGLLLGKMLIESVGQIHGAVLAAGAANGDGHIAAVVGLEFGDPACQEADYIGQH
jgi:hypothetical protein